MCTKGTINRSIFFRDISCHVWTYHGRCVVLCVSSERRLRSSLVEPGFSVTKIIMIRISCQCTGKPRPACTSSGHGAPGHC